MDRVKLLHRLRNCSYCDSGRITIATVSKPGSNENPTCYAELSIYVQMFHVLTRVGPLF